MRHINGCDAEAIRAIQIAKRDELKAEKSRLLLFQVRKIKSAKERFTDARDALDAANEEVQAAEVPRNAAHLEAAALPAEEDDGECSRPSPAHMLQFMIELPPEQKKMRGISDTPDIGDVPTPVRRKMPGI